MHEPEGVISEAEQAFERWRRRAGFVAAPVIFLAVWFVPISGLTPAAHHLAAILATCVVLWMSEALPMAATALFGPTLCVLAGIASAREVFKSFADPIIFLFIGSFILVEAMMKHGVNRRVAFIILRLPLVGESPFRLYAAFGFITTFVSMWVSNAATTAMMLPIGIAIVTEMARRESVATGRTRHFTTLPFATGLMLLTAFGASVGGLATPIGTPPNLIGIGMIEKTLGVKVAFFEWMKLGFPIAVLLGVFLVWRFHRTCPADPASLRGSGVWLRSEAEKLGPWTRAEQLVVIVFGVAVMLWILPGIVALTLGAESPAGKWLTARLPESIVALLAAVALFVLPVNWRAGEFTLTWKEAARIDWGTIFLFAGGMALGEQMFATGLARWVGDGLAALVNARSELGLVALFAAVSILVSEATSNTASATMVVPVAIAVAQSAGVDPLKPALAATLACSMGFLLPVSTGPNAIVYGSGCVPLLKMMRHGALLDVVGFVVIVVAVMLLGP